LDPQISILFTLEYDDAQIDTILDYCTNSLFNTSELKNLILFKIINKYKTISDYVVNSNPADKLNFIDKFNVFKLVCLENIKYINLILTKINEYIGNTTHGHIDKDRMGQMHQIGGYYKKYLKYKKKYLEKNN